MSKETKFQQQILFEEQEIKLESDKDLPQSQVIVDNDDWQPELNDESESLALQQEAEQESSSNWLWRVFAVAFVAVIGVELFDFFATGLVESPITTSLYGIVLLCVTLLAGSSLFKEFSGLSQLKKRNDLREQISRAMSGDINVDAKSLCQSVTDSLPSDLSASQEKLWQEMLDNEYSDEELFNLYSRQILSETDQKALAEVAKYSSESTVLVALSPVALLDMLIMLWRNLTLVDKVAGLYGLKLGYWSRIKLVKQVITNMLYAGASEVITDISVDMLGADLLGKLSGRLAQGLGAGMLTARLGLKAIYLCRPMPFDENAPKLSQVRKEIISQIKQLVKN